MSIYSDKLAHVQVVINCWYSVGQSAREKTYSPDIFFRRAVLDDIMSQNELTTLLTSFGINQFCRSLTCLP